MPSPDTAYLWSFLPKGYLFTILIETPILIVGLSTSHPLRRRIAAGLWLTACTYPIVVLVLPILLNAESHRGMYLAVAETFAPVAECALFAAAFHARSTISRANRLRDFAAIVVANLLSFLLPELTRAWLW